MWIITHYLDSKITMFEFETEAEVSRGFCRLPVRFRFTIT
jgi:hypothetical protein